MGDGSLQSHSGANLNPKRATNRTMFRRVAKPAGLPSHHCLLDSGSKGVLLSLEFMHATGMKTFSIKQPIALQLACIGSRSMINYGMNMTIRFGRETYVLEA
jgi:hypothetical protein